MRRRFPFDGSGEGNRAICARKVGGAVTYRELIGGLVEVIEVLRARLTTSSPVADNG